MGLYAWRYIAAFVFYEGSPSQRDHHVLESMASISLQTPACVHSIYLISNKEKKNEMLCENKCSCFQYTAGRAFCWSVSQQYAWTSQALRSRTHFERKYFLTLCSLNNKQAHTFVFQIWVSFCLLTSLTLSYFIFFSPFLIYQGPVFFLFFLGKHHCSSLLCDSCQGHTWCRLGNE